MANRLSRESSPYLRSAAGQPVEWHAWGAEAFAKAAAEDKPVLLDVGAVWCHWCHVMDHESYDDPKLADLINERFVPVKVDRDERPDVDARYQRAVQALTGQGGWPLTAFLTPEGEVFYGGTYFPPRDAHGRPSFRRVLEGVSEFYRSDAGKAREQAARIRGHLAAHGPKAKAGGDLSDASVQEAVNHALATLDPVHGGFGGAPKFPHTGAIQLLLRRHAETASGAMRTAVLATLDGMARGGVHDHVGGGFHRYGVDARWIIPHFEKMLYDNAGLLANYVEAWQLWKRPEDRAVAEGVVRFLRDVLRQDGGGFGGSQDADRGPGDDGDYFTWTREEARAVLDDGELRVVALHFGLGEDEAGARPPNAMHHDPARRVLWEAFDLDAIASGLKTTREEAAATLEAATAKMRVARGGREAPFVDPTIYASWNGMAASALFAAGGAFGDATIEALAFETVDRLLRDAYDPARGFAHALAAGDARGWDLLDDQAQMGYALLDAHAASGDDRYASAAREVAAVLETRFFDGVAFRDRAGAGEVAVLGEAEHPITDSPTPAPNATACRFLLRLGTLDDEERWTKLAERALGAFADAPSRWGLSAASYALAVDEALRPPPKVTLVGTADATRPLRAAARAAYAPGLVATRVDRQGAVVPPAAVPCFGARCLAPVADPERLATALRTGRP